MIDIAELVSNPRVLSSLTRSGWRPERKVDIAQWLTWYEEEGYEVPVLASQILETFGGLRIEPAPNPRRSFASGVIFFDPAWAATGESSRILSRAHEISTALWPVGEWIGEYILLADDAGTLYAETTFQFLRAGDGFAGGLTNLIIGNQPLIPAIQ